MKRGTFQHKIMMKVVQISKDRQRKKVATEEEDLTKVVEVEKATERLPIDVTDVTIWVTNLLNVLRMIIQDSEVHT